MCVVLYFYYTSTIPWYFKFVLLWLLSVLERNGSSLYTWFSIAVNTMDDGQVLISGRTVTRAT